MKRLMCILLAVLLLGGCAPREQLAQQTIFAMDTVMTMQLWGADSQRACQILGQLFVDMEQTWSAVSDGSVISALNRGENVSSEEQAAFLGKVQALSERTGGAFDPKLGGKVALWGFYDDDYRIPTANELEAAPELWDLGAVVKGYAGDLAIQQLEALDVDGGVLSLGGNVQTYGRKTTGEPWHIGIQNPYGGETLGVIHIAGTAAIVTSGDYQRYFEKDGIRYHHILDPKTGCPAASGLSSVTVICRDGTTADALSTALFVMGLEEGTEFWRQSDDFEAVFVLATGEIYATEGVTMSGCEFEVIRK